MPPTKKNALTARLHTLVHEEILKDVEALAEETGVTQQAVVREAVYEYLERKLGGPSEFAIRPAYARRRQSNK
ncbi:ribbon-helix-helix protein, CopG family [Streptomyces sp. NBC_00459]|uniref:ribbon-helix-helix protein, CopG family n=1 Tax=Streptomyces sp. NBC_00459 TaxID=2975749 RepID=UPI002E1799BA